MAMKKCPGCGGRYHGRRCPECLYEPFEETKGSPTFHREWKPPEVSGSWHHTEGKCSSGGASARKTIFLSLFFFLIILGLVFSMTQTVV